ncbi:MAG TPA: coagulation factor 5/8 type domain-containing protein, partial [Polyangiaceae bacterium]
IQGKLDSVYSQQDAAQFGAGRYAYFFKPGQYALDVKVGFYVQAIGLGQSPDDVSITGAVRSKADWLGSQNATCNFWRGAENLSVTPAQSIDSGADVWAVSQGTHLRRVHVKGDVHLDDGGWSSGGFIADSLVDGQLVSGSQQQFLTRNDDQTWAGSNWNMVFVGDGTPPSGSWPSPPYTTTAATPVVREKPFLYVDAGGSYLVMVPGLKKGTTGHSWASTAPPGVPLSIDRFYLAKPGTDTAATMNAALAAGKHLMLTPGIYHLEASLEVTLPGTIVMGLGLATLIPDQGTPILSVADVDGVTLAGLLLEAGPASSPTLLEIGPAGSSKDHATAPAVAFDVHCRVGGADVGTASRCVTVNSSDVIIDNTWLWRADHGAGASWTGNRSDNGLVVNGDRVTVYGLFVEHFQQYQTLWNGNGGAVYFYQSEMPYDPPDQASWQASPGHDGYPSYKVADGVTSHQAEGLGVYSVFDNDVTASNAIETPSGAGIAMHHMVTVSLAAGSITHIVDGTGGSVGNGTMTSFSGN